MMKHALKVTTPADTEIQITRVFDAPRRLVWDAMTKPELLRRWLFGPPGWEMTICEDHAEPGSTFHWGWRGPGGETLSMRGTYREVAAPERIVRTESFEMGCPSQGGEQLCTLILKEDAGKTTLTLTIVYPSKEARDGALASGMEGGIAAGYDRLDDILTRQAA